MLQEIKITDDQIKIAERILLPEGIFFDAERIAFIKDLSTHDLHAVPGSGKTTALLAKLIAMEQHLPLADQSGILAISHTNAAINEIKNRVGHVCPRLLGYPNFIGTIQQFVDTFLAIPYYKTCYRRRPVRIDDEIYNENHFPDFKLKAYLDNRADGKNILYNYRLREGDNLTFRLENKPFIFPEKSSTYQKILVIKKGLRENGFLCFDDAYILAHEYLVKYPAIINIIRNRFSYVFVDEMQDIGKHQYDLLEKLFGDAAEVSYQRIGDKNQAIFTPESEMLDIWQGRNIKQLNGSHRLHPATACIVESLALDPIAVTGNRVNLDGSSIEIKPVMLVFDDSVIAEVIPSFAEIIKELIIARKISPQTDSVYKAIAWTTSKPDDKDCVIKLNHYHKGFSKDNMKLKINYPCLESYLYYYEKGTNKLASIRKSILNSVLRIIRLERILNPVYNRSFTKRSLIDFFKQEHPTFYSEFKLHLYKIAALSADGKTIEALKLLTKLAIDILAKLDSGVKLSKFFFDTKHIPVTGAQVSCKATENPNYFSKDGINIEIATVHAVKGQTHTCTLYMESFYQINVSHKGQYESSRVADQLLGTVLPSDAHDYIKQSLKMTYVGFSRATHLLVFAVHKSRFDSLYAGKPNLDRWDVRRVQASNKPVQIQMVSE